MAKLLYARVLLCACAPTPEAAAKIRLGDRDEVSDLHVKLQAVPAQAIRKLCLNPDGSPVSSGKITPGEGPPVPPGITTESAPDGSFEFPAVADAEWVLCAQGHDSERPSR